MAGEATYASKPWLKSYDKGVPEKIQYEEICMPDILDRVAAKWPTRMALNFQGYTINYKGLNDMVNRFATCLAGMGIKKGDAVAIILPNMIPCVAAYYAIHRIGAIVVLNNPTYSDRELEHQLKDRQGDFAAGLGGDVDDTAAGADRIQALGEIVAPDHVQNHIDAALRLGDFAL